MKVTYVDHMGTDLSVVNSARVSFNKKSEVEYCCGEYCGDICENPEYGDTCPRLKDEDVRLIQFLARGCTSGDWEKILDDVQDAAQLDGFNEKDVEAILKYVKRMPEHWTPFGHTAITLHIKAPIFVARQLGKHQVGFVWNEVSRRYVTDEPEFYVPEVWRKAAQNVKQGSSDEEANIESWWVNDFEIFRPEILMDVCVNYYNMLIEDGVCPEQARMVLPQSMYTEWYWTGNLYGFANVFKLRTDSHTQKETRDIAHQIGEIIKPLYPVSWEALTQ